MSDLLGISSGAVQAYQRALSTVSNNIANVNTEGYSRQQAVLQDNVPVKQGNSYFGTGVMFNAVKRSFDEFADSNLRKSTSDLMSQESLVNYAQRVIDILGDKSIGLNSALDTFFGAAINLSVEPASSVQRTAFLRATEGVTSRFGELAGQLDLVRTESMQAIDSQIGQFNSLGSQLALINVQLKKEAEVKNQPAELLDRRDLILRQMAEFAGIKTKYQPNGAVDVSIGSLISSSLVVSGTQARPIGIDTVGGNLNFKLDPYGDNQPLEDIPSGQLGGLSRFIQDVLDPAQSNLDALAKVMVDEVNQVQRNGIDGYGQKGLDLLALDPEQAHAAAGLSVSIGDPLRIATASQFTVVEGAQNIDAVKASVRYSASAPAPLISNPGLVNNANPLAGVPADISSEEGFQFITEVAPGALSPTFYLDNATGDQQLQVMTEDGRHLAGSTLSLNDRVLLINQPNGYQDGTQYSDKYLNQGGAKGFQNLAVFYGAKASVLSSQMFDANGNLLPGNAMPATIEGKRVLRPENSYSVLTNAFRINGQNWPNSALLITKDTNDIPKLLADSMNGIAPGVQAQAYNRVEFDSSKLVFGKALIINNQPVTGAQSQTNIKGLIDSINLEATGVVASLGDRGQLVLENIAANGGQDITLRSGTGGEVSVLGELDQSYTGRVRLTRDLEDPRASQLTLELGQNGSADLMSAIGLSLGTFSPEVRLPHPATLDGGRVPLPLQTLTMTPGALVLNTVPLPMFNLTGNEADPVQAMADWINSAHVPDVQAVAYNQVEADPAKMNLTRDLYVNGHLISGANDLAELIDKINQADDTVTARVTALGRLVIENKPETQGKTIRISGATDDIAGINALGIKSQDYTGMLRITREISDPANSNIELGFGEGGKPSFLASLGFRTGAYIEGKVTDKLRVYVTGSGSSSSVAASFAGEPLDMVDKLRAQTLSIRFTAADRYEILDAKTGAQLADRYYTPSGKPLLVEYQGLKMTLSSDPTAGDLFSINGNDNGLGDNRNMMDLVDLSKQKVMNGRTLGEAYIEQVNDVGDVAQRAKISQEALKVVNDQASAARNKVSGVNLDEEAADLIRYQQAYQAAAKALQISTDLFNAIQQIR